VPGTVRSPFLLTVTLVKVVTPAVISLPSSCCALPVFSGNIKVLFPATDGASIATNPDVDPFSLSAIVYLLVKLFMNPQGQRPLLQEFQFLQLLLLELPSIQELSQYI